MQQKKILIMDDDEDLLITMGCRLTDAGYLVLSASNGDEGLYYLAREKPDLILLDVSMPGMDGHAFIEEMKKKTGQEHAKKLHPPVIVLTGKGLGLKEKFLSAGATEFVVKPFTATHLVKLIEGIWTK